MPGIPETWLDQLTANQTAAGNQSDPDIVQLANGDILVAWTSDDNSGPGSPTGTDVIGLLYDPLGNRIGGEFRLNASFGDDDERNIDMAALPGGGFIAAYEDDDGGGTVNIRLNELDSQGSHVADDPTVIADVAGDPAYRNPRIAVSSGTSALIAYEVTVGASSTIQGKIYDPSSDTYGAQFSLLTNSGVTAPDVTVLANGDYLVAAEVDMFGDNSIVYRIVDSAGGNVLAADFVTDTQINGDDDRDVSVAALTGGGFVIAWTSTDSNDTDVEYMYYDASGVEVFGGFAGLDPGAVTDDNNEPVVAGLADGSFVIVIDNDDLDQMEVTHVDPGPGQGGTFRFAGSGTTSAVTDFGDGRFAVTWKAHGTDEIAMEILDTRDFVNDPAAYAPESWQVGTIDGDIFTTDTAAGIVHGHGGGDTITEASGGLLQQVFGDDGNDIVKVVSVISGDSWDGGAGTDTIDWSASIEAGATFDLEAGTASDSAGNDIEEMLGFENFTGTLNADTIVGTGLSNTLRGGDGDDTIGGGDGIDALIGGAGGDSLDGGDGIDTASYAGAAAAVTVHLTAGAGSGGDAQGDTYVNIEWVVGGGAGDTLIGGATANVLNGVGGGDTIQGWGADDALFGNAGGDVLDGGTGRDILNGGAQADHFVLAHQAHSVVGALRDIVVDFLQVQLDKIDVSLVDAKANTAGNDAFTQFLGVGAFTAEGQIRAFQSGANTIVEFNTAGAAGADMQVQLNAFTAANLTLADFVL